MNSARLSFFLAFSSLAFLSAFVSLICRLSPRLGNALAESMGGARPPPPPPAAAAARALGVNFAGLTGSFSEGASSSPPFSASSSSTWLAQAEPVAGRPHALMG